MGIEIERKFLLKNDTWREGAAGVIYHQGYLSLDPQRTVRVRIFDDRGMLTIKGASAGASRTEFEYAIPVGEARQLLDRLCFRPQIEKTRYRIPHGGLTWEVDEFHGENLGLVLAEVELEQEEQPVELPPWVGREVTGDERYFNAYLCRHPYRSWAESAR